MNTKFLSSFAVGSVISALLGIFFNGIELSLFGMAVTALVLLIAATDYAPRHHYARVLCERKERLPYAA